MLKKFFKNYDISSLINDDNYENVIEFKNFNLWSKSENRQMLKNINISIKKNTIVGIIGPSGSGKSTLIRCINKSNLEDNKYKTSGEIIYKKINILNDVFPSEILRTQIGLVFQKPICFPMSIKENILFAIKAHGIYDEAFLYRKLEKLLRNCFLWDELKYRLDERPENTLSGGQQQRLCIARAIALQPLVLLMDEPTSSLDPKSNNKIEELILKISKTTTVILVSHSFAQIKRISEYTIFLKDGEVIEHDLTRKIFTNPESQITKDFISGKY